MIVANSKALASANTREWSRLLRERQPVRFPAGNVYFDGTAIGPPTIGAKYVTEGGCGYPVGGHPGMTGLRTRAIQLAKDAPFYRGSITGLYCPDPIEWVYDKYTDVAAWEIEGRLYPATGRNYIANQTFSNCGAAFRALGGYYEGTKFIADENHADNTIVVGCETFDCKKLFWSENQQAVNWSFRDCRINGDGTVAAWLDRGGHVTFDNLVVNDPAATLFSVRDYSPHNCKLTFTNVHVDHFDDFSFTILEYRGPEWQVECCRWILEGSVFLPTESAFFEEGCLYRVPKDMPLDRSAVRIYDMGAVAT